MTTQTAADATISALIVFLRCISDVALNQDFLTLAEAAHRKGIPGANTTTVGEAFDAIADELAPRLTAGEDAYIEAMENVEAAFRAARREGRPAPATAGLFDFITDPRLAIL